MKKKVSKFLYYAIIIGLLSIGLGMVYYAFELVSIPHVNEYSEGGFVTVGLILVICGVVTGIFHVRKAKQHPNDPKTATSQAM